MSNNYLPDETPLAPGDRARSEDVNIRYESTVSAFDKLPAPASGKKGFSEPCPVGEPTEDDHAVTKGFAETGMTSQLAQATTQASNSANSAAAALASEQKAAKWADEAEDVEVETGKFSAKHWAQKLTALFSNVFKLDATNEVTGHMNLANNSKLRAKQVDGTNRDVVHMDANDKVNIGAANNSLNLRGSEGVPAYNGVDVFEHGSNANGDYVKLLDGTLICWSNKLTLTYNSASECRATWTFPAAAFSSDYAITPSIRGSAIGTAPNSVASNATPGSADLTAAHYGSITNNSVGIAIRRVTGTTDFASGDELYVGITMVGRWK